MPSDTAATKRCAWAEAHPLLTSYHDEEWGVPIHDDRHFYEKLVLDGAQAGLSWLTILKKREAYREALCGFDPERVAAFGARDEARLMKNAGIVRNKLKVRSAVINARAFLAVQAEHGSFDRYIWGLVGGQTLHNRLRRMSDVPARTELSDAVSKDLKKRGFTFVGTTIIYAFMQASGLVNDHLVSCHRYAVVSAMDRKRLALHAMASRPGPALSSRTCRRPTPPGRSCTTTRSSTWPRTCGG